MSHRLSHTFPICDAAAQTQVRPLFPPHSALNPLGLPLPFFPSCFSSYISVDSEKIDLDGKKCL